MKTLIIFVAAVLSVQPVVLQTTELLGNSGFIPQPQQQIVPKVPAILRLHSDANPDGSFTYTFDTENGISAHAESTITKTADPEQSIQSIRGQYSYTGPDGVQYTVQYIADHNGFQAFGEHLPTPPPIPEAILRSLDHNAAHPEEDGGIVASTPALAPASILANTIPRTPLQPIVAAPLTRFEPLSNPTAAPPKQEQQLAQPQLLAQTQVLQQQQLQPQQYQISPLQLQQLQFTQVQPQQLQLPQLQPRSLQPQQLQPQQLQPQQLQPQQLQPQQLQPQQLQPQQLQPQQLQPQQLQIQLQQPQPQQLQLQPQQPQQLQLQPQQPQPQQLQLQPQQLLPQQFQPQPQPFQPQQLQAQQLSGRPLQPQDFVTQFAPSFQNIESQRRVSTSA